MQPIKPMHIQDRIDRLKDRDVYLHLEMTTGAYAAHNETAKHPATAFVTNGAIRYTSGSIKGNGPYRVGLKTERGWIYADGLTHHDEGETSRLILAGHDPDGKLVVAIMLSETPF